MEPRGRRNAFRGVRPQVVNGQLDTEALAAASKPSVSTVKKILSDKKPASDRSNIDFVSFRPRNLAELKSVADVKYQAMLKLDLSLCKDSLGDKELIDLINKDTLNIKSLNLSGCNNISDDAIVKLAESRHQLQSLDISDCTKLTNFVFLP